MTRESGLYYGKPLSATCTYGSYVATSYVSGIYDYNRGLYDYNRDWNCEYCGAMNHHEKYRCHNCFAPRLN